MPAKRSCRCLHCRELPLPTHSPHTPHVVCASSEQLAGPDVCKEGGHLSAQWPVGRWLAPAGRRKVITLPTNAGQPPCASRQHATAGTDLCSGRACTGAHLALARAFEAQACAVGAVPATALAGRKQLHGRCMRMGSVGGWVGGWWVGGWVLPGASCLCRLVGLWCLLISHWQQPAGTGSGCHVGASGSKCRYYIVSNSPQGLRKRCLKAGVG